MSGLRDRQKQQRHRAILEAASALFVQRGYGDSSMEQIARAANVSVGTLYNYFKSKGDIGLAIHRADTDLVRGETDAVIADPPADPVEAVLTMMEVDLNSTLGYVDGTAWRELMAAAFTTPGGLSDTFAEAENLRIQQFRRLLEGLAARGLLVEGLDLEALAQVFGALNTAHFLQWMAGLDAGAADPARPIEGAGRARLERQVRQIMRGLLR